MNKLETLHQDLGLSIRERNIFNYILVAAERTDSIPENIKHMIKDISEEFKFLKDEEIREAMRKGGLGVYGRTYKLSTQEICIWIREYLKDKNKNRSI